MVDYRTMIRNRNKFIALAIVIVVLAILYAVAMDFPSADEIVAMGSYAGILVGEIIKVVLAIILIILTLVARPALKIILAYYGLQLIKDKNTGFTDTETNVNKFAGNLATLIAVGPLWVAAGYVFDFASFSLLTFIDVSYSTAHTLHDWAHYIPLIIFIPVILVAIVKCVVSITAASNADGRVSESKSVDRLSETDTEMPDAKKCPECNRINAMNARFCSSCGTQLHSRIRM